MARVRLLHGKPLTVGGKVALSDDCCCTPAPPTGCPVSVTFNGLEFCCACDGFGGAIEWFEDADNHLNGIPIPVGSFTTLCDFCQYDREGAVSLRANFGSECPVTDDFGTSDLTLELTNSGGVWYIMLYFKGLRNILFNGTTTGTVANNDFTDCTLTTQTFSNPMVTCDPDNLGGDFCVVAKNGTATLNY